MSNVFSTKNEDAYIQWLRVADILENLRNYKAVSGYVSTTSPYYIKTPTKKELKEVPPEGFENLYI